MKPDPLLPNERFMLWTMAHMLKRAKSIHAETLRKQTRLTKTRFKMYVGELQRRKYAKLTDGGVLVAIKAPHRRVLKG